MIVIKIVSLIGYNITSFGRELGWVRADRRITEKKYLVFQSSAALM